MIVTVIWKFRVVHLVSSEEAPAVGCDGLGHTDGFREGAPKTARESRALPEDVSFARPGTAEREREGSAARSIQRTKMRRAARCRVTAAQQLGSEYANKRA